MRIKMQQGSRCNENQDGTRIKMQRGSRCNKNQDAPRIKMQRGSRCNEDQDETSIKMQKNAPDSISIRHLIQTPSFKGERRHLRETGSLEAFAQAVLADDSYLSVGCTAVTSRNSHVIWTKSHPHKSEVVCNVKPQTVHGFDCSL